GFEIVGSVKNKVPARKIVSHIVRGEVGDDAFDGNRRVNGTKFLLGSNSFWQGLAGVSFVEQGLALKIRRFDVITIKNAEAAYACARKERGGCGTDGSATHNNGASCSQALLTCFADARKEHLARVAFERSRIGKK